MRTRELHLSDKNLIHRGHRFWTYRANWSNQSVVIKTIRSGGDSRGLSEFLKNESHILALFDNPGIEKLLTTQEVDGKPALLLQDVGSDNLAAYLTKGPMHLSQFYDFAILLSQAIGAIHEQNVIHRDINPSNIVLGEFFQPTLVDFELATSITGAAGGGVQGELEGALAYIAPEQTGRMDRLVDHRTDLYSLGATLYHALIGTPPFSETDPMELVRLHLAVMPTTPKHLRSEIPLALSNIIMKLLSKMPENRYQSAQALVADLIESKNLWQKGSTQTFELGREDLVRMLPFPERLYGRDEELEKLKNCAHNVKKGSKEFVFLRGSAGIGKTALADEISRLFPEYTIINGKCDQLRTEAPYATLVEAFQNNIRHILALPQSQRTQWKEKIHQALEANGRILTEVIPELEKLIGIQPETVHLGPVETENRLHLTFKSFVNVLAGPQQPLLIFLDDLQWADLSSLRLLQSLIEDSEIKYLFLIGAFRREEVGPNHPLNQQILNLESNRAALTLLDIEPLSIHHITEFLCDLLRTEPATASALAEIVLRKTAGNPFFIKRFLRYLQKSHILSYDVTLSRWEWDIQQVEGVALSENVVDLMVRAIQDLPEDTQKILKIMASIGHSTDLNLLSLVAQKTQEEAGRNLWPALHEQLLIPIRSQQVKDNVSYAFVHDRVQQAVYSLLTEQEKNDIHHSIGQQMLNTFTKEQLDNFIFDVTDQLNLCEKKISIPLEQIQLAELNLQAGAKARVSAAFEPALRYFNKALFYFKKHQSEANTQWIFQSYKGAIECAFLTNQTELGQQLASEAFQYAKTSLEQAELYSLRVMESTLRGAFAESIRWGKDGLALLDLRLPMDRLDTAVIEIFSSVDSEIAQRSGEELLHLPEVKDQVVAAKVKLLSELLPAAYLSHQILWTYLNLQIVLLSLKHGHSVDSSTGFAAYAMLLVRQGEYSKANNMGLFCMNLARRFSNPSKTCEALLMIADFVHHWFFPFTETDAIFRRAFSKSMESGNLQWAAYIRAGRLSFLCYTGLELSQLSLEADSTVEFSQKAGSKPMLEMSLTYRQLTRCLRGLTLGQGLLESDDFSEDKFLENAKENQLALACLAMAQLQVAFFFGNKENLPHCLERAEKLLPAFEGIFPVMDYYFYAGLTLAQLNERDKMEPFVQRISVWAKNCPENFLHRDFLLQAEIARLENKSLAATIHLYEQSIKHAALGGFIHDEALACELCGRLFYANHNERIARVYILEACEKYTRWGATAKTSALREEFFELTRENLKQNILTTHAGHLRDSFLDLFGLLKSIEKISGELILSRLLEQLFEISLQIAGAEKGALVLRENENLIVYATVSAKENLIIEKKPLALATNELAITIIERVFSSGTSLVVADAFRSGAYASDIYVVKNQTKSVLAVPIVRPGKQIGVLYFENNLATRAFTSDRIDSLNLLSSQIAVSIENSLLFEKIQHEVKERTKAEAAAKFMADASVLLSGSLDYADTLEKVANLMVPFLADWCTVDIINRESLSHETSVTRVASRANNPETQRLIDELDQKYPAKLDSKVPAANAIKTRECQLIPEVTAEIIERVQKDSQHGRLIKVLGTKSAMAAPLIVRGKVLGAITLHSKTSRRFTEGDIPLVEELARRCAVAIENAHLYDEAQKSIQLRDDFIAIASHELRTPLTPMKMQVQILKKYLKDFANDPTKIEKVAQIVDGTDRQLERLSTLVEDMLDVSRMSAGQIALDINSCDFSAIVRNVIQQFHNEFKKYNTPVLVNIPASIIGYWDAKRLEQVVVNFITNAIKYGRGKNIEISLTTVDNKAIFSVKDHGIGLSQEQQSKLFGRFVRLVPIKNYGGLGLGLYIVRQIVDAHHGEIHVESKLGEGATFSAILPMDSRTNFESAYLQ